MNYDDDLDPHGGCVRDRQALHAALDRIRVAMKKHYPGGVDMDSDAGLAAATDTFIEVHAGVAKAERWYASAMSRLRDALGLKDAHPYASNDVEIDQLVAEIERLRAAEAQLADLRKRSEVTRAWITETCIANRGRDGAINEALLRVQRAAYEVFDGWGERFRGDVKLHFVLQIERPTESEPEGDVRGDGLTDAEKRQIRSTPTSGVVYWFAETVDAPPRYYVMGVPGTPSHLTDNPLKAARLSKAQALDVCSSLYARCQGWQLRPVEHIFVGSEPMGGAS